MNKKELLNEIQEMKSKVYHLNNGQVGQMKNHCADISHELIEINNRLDRIMLNMTGQEDDTIKPAVSPLEFAEEFTNFIRDEIVEHDFYDEQKQIEDEIDVEFDWNNKSISVDTTIAYTDIETTFINCMESILFKAYNSYEKYLIQEDKEIREEEE